MNEKAGAETEAEIRHEYDDRKARRAPAFRPGVQSAAEGCSLD
jgi:hypothetical protein